MAIQLPAITIPDNILIVVENDNECNEIWPDVWPANAGIFHFTEQPPEDLNIKYCGNRYKFLGDLNEPVTSCLSFCALNESFNCISGECE